MCSHRLTTWALRFCRLHSISPELPLKSNPLSPTSLSARPCHEDQLWPPARASSRARHIFLTLPKPQETSAQRRKNVHSC